MKYRLISLKSVFFSRESHSKQYRHMLKRRAKFMHMIRDFERNIQSHPLPKKQLDKYLQNFMLLSEQISCPAKASYSFEEAAFVYGVNGATQSGQELYLCQTCGYLHFGHHPAWISKLKHANCTLTQ
ncbi:Uncharacterised protein [uncultured archaeon]|nr:Uncharacterised protein [uncultured archaeon]